MDDFEVAIAVVTAGAEHVRRRFGMAMGRLEKGGGDFATDADIQAENAMLSVLARERPDDGVIAEESGRTGASDAPRTWLLDPLCGTRNYAAKMRVVAVNAALTSTRGVLAAAVADPFSAEVFWSDGRSSQVSVGGQDTPLAPHAYSRLVDLNLDPPFPNAAVFRAADLAADNEFLASFSPRAVSSSLALTWVANGQRAGYITDGDMRHSVHFSAGLAICQASGCRVTDLHGRRLGTTPTGAIVAADEETHLALLRVVAQSQR